MSARLARAVVLLAARTMGEQRGAWGRAMQAELDAAIADRRPVVFAAGCLLAALRELPANAQGRLALAHHLLAIGLLVPLAGLLMYGGLLGYPYLAFGKAGFGGFLAGNSEQLSLLNAGDWAVAPALTLLVFSQAAGQLGLAWHVLEGDWPRVAAIARFNAAAVTTLMIVTSLLSIIDATMVLGAVGVIAETLALLALASWHERRSLDEWLERSPCGT